MKVEIGRLKQFDAAVFALKRGETAWLEFSVGKQLDTRKVSRMQVRMGQDNKMARIFAEDDYGVFEIPMAEPFGSQAGSAPMFMGHHGGLDCYLTYQCYPFGHILQISIQLYFENE